MICRVAPVSVFWIETSAPAAALPNKEPTALCAKAPPEAKVKPSAMQRALRRND
ncbi:MAG TPA: hypothetical protein VLM17_01210 [Xanthomonadaceae bacterium]|nr:hypothetical protein [Xanthomonadaceae bacterium]